MILKIAKEVYEGRACIKLNLYCIMQSTGCLGGVERVNRG